MTEMSTLVEPPARTGSRADRRRHAEKDRGHRGRLAITLACTWLLLVGLAGVLADVLPLRPVGQIVGAPCVPVGESWAQPFGTDAIGRSVTSRLVFGARESTLIGCAAVALAMAVGLAIGLSGGYLRGWVDRLTSILVDAVLAIPPLVLLLAVAALGRRDVGVMSLGLGLVCAPSFARVARANTMALVQRPSFLASRAMGASTTRIIVRSLLPEVTVALLPYAFLVFAYVIVSEASLSFLGLGIPSPTPSWGGMINDGRPVLADSPQLVFVPACCILLTVASLSVLGDRARTLVGTGGR